MPGAYFMISQTINDGKKDTKLTDLKQLKIYTDEIISLHAHKIQRSLIHQ